ncbi:MAG: hypothetical protein KatS3mg076_2119 [Candidatus Binatia bacterium]|nr:MAG: hypothetical protein KatS3mg076_2119 [Candidatus Binatia bacterium]
MTDETIEVAGLRLPRLGLGTWAWGDRATWGMGTYDRSYDYETIREAFRVSVDAGVTLLDTAEMYGNGESERIIGRLLREDPDRARRVLVATKFIPYPWRVPMKAALRRALEASLERLGLPFVHLYQIHGPISLRPARVLAEALARAVGDGLVRAVGISNYSEREMRAMHAALALHGVPLATNQVEYSLLRRLPERSGLLRACSELGVVLLAYSPLAQGRLTGKYSVENPPPGRRQFSDYPMEEVEPVLEKLREIGSRYGKTPSQVALNWLLCKGTVPIPGAKNGAQAAENAGALGWRLSPEDVERLDTVAKEGRRTLFHRLWQHG